MQRYLLYVEDSSLPLGHKLQRHLLFVEDPSLPLWLFAAPRAQAAREPAEAEGFFGVADGTVLIKHKKDADAVITTFLAPSGAGMPAAGLMNPQPFLPKCYDGENTLFVLILAWR